MNDVFLWGALPYLTVAMLVGGTLWRYSYDKFGWTTRSSELYESRILRVASPLFHFGLLGVIAGHLLGLLVPESWTDAVGLSEHRYHLMALTLGIVAGLATVAGLAVLIWRRRTNGPVFLATTRNDKVMYVFLAAALLLGMAATLINAAGRPYDYRLTVGPWTRSLFELRPRVGLMAGAPLEFRIHTVAGLALFALLPFTRLVHAFTAPVGYLVRPYIVYRSRDPRSIGTAAARRGWEPVE